MVQISTIQKHFGIQILTIVTEWLRTRTSRPIVFWQKGFNKHVVFSDIVNAKSAAIGFFFKRWTTYIDIAIFTLAKIFIVNYLFIHCN